MKTKTNIIIILIVIIFINTIAMHTQVYAQGTEKIILVKSLNNEDPTSKNISIAVNQSRTIIVSISPSNVSNKKLLWKSSNNKIATVSSTGRIKGIKTGTCTVTATTCDGSNKSIKYNINVKKRKTRYKF